LGCRPFRRLRPARDGIALKQTDVTFVMRERVVVARIRLWRRGRFDEGRAAPMTVAEVARKVRRLGWFHRCCGGSPVAGKKVQHFFFAGARVSLAGNSGENLRHYRVQNGKKDDSKCRISRTFFLQDSVSDLPNYWAVSPPSFSVRRCLRFYEKVTFFYYHP